MPAYLFDDVSVIASDAILSAGPDKTITHIGDTVQIGLGSDGDGIPAYWYVLGSTTPIDSGGSTHVHPDTTTTYVITMQTCGEQTKYDTVTVFVKKLGIADPGWLSRNLSVYPVPTKESLTIEGAGACSYELLNVLGARLLTGTLHTARETISLQSLPTGTYYLQVTDAAGYRVVKRVLKE